MLDLARQAAGEADKARVAALGLDLFDGRQLNRATLQQAVGEARSATSEAGGLLQKAATKIERLPGFGSSQLPRALSAVTAARDSAFSAMADAEEICGALDEEAPLPDDAVEEHIGELSEKLTELVRGTDEAIAQIRRYWPVLSDPKLERAISYAQEAARESGLADQAAREAEQRLRAREGVDESLRSAHWRATRAGRFAREVGESLRQD
ncbi:hypothetical protein D5H78_18655 [Vallicoccus soli]|uniref:Uncharacterized protein n=2 Tax=Vallicoccus soli TaxID=2339232 RepID=A0A3A3YTW9_9ACTN|nr:hypothetical protein D5H78_18655 [Vallicoccus soli]